MNLSGLTDSVGGLSDATVKCRQCGASMRLGNGLCLSCTLREGLESDREASRDSFEAILAEDEVQDTALARRQLRDSGGNRARRNGRDLSRAAAAFTADRRAKANGVVSRRFARDAGAFPA